jgi:hypothetical protein
LPTARRSFRCPDATPLQQAYRTAQKRDFCRGCLRHCRIGPSAHLRNLSIVPPARESNGASHALRKFGEQK